MEKVETKEFSLGAAKECADVIFTALPRSKKMELVGAYNELLVPLERAIRKLGRDWTGDEK